MELRHLRYLLAIAEEGNFTRASDRVHVSQPALSQQIRQLEKEIGVPLVERRRDGSVLTDAGELLRASARRIFREIDDVRSAIEELGGLDRGALVIGAVQTVNSYLLPEVVATFRSLHPGVTLRVLELSADEIEKRLVGGDLSIGLGFVPANDPAVDGEALFEEELVLIASPRHRFRDRRTVRLAELAGEPLILLPEAFCTRRLVAHCFQKAGIPLQTAVEMDSIEGIVATVSAVEGATILPALTREQARQYGLVAVRLTHPTPRRTVGILRHRKAHDSAAMRRFAELAREVASDKKKRAA